MQDQADMATAMSAAAAQQGEMDTLQQQAEHERELEKIAFKENLKKERK
jgi:hypothetical protein